MTFFVLNIGNFGINSQKISFFANPAEDFSNDAPMTLTNQISSESNGLSKILHLTFHAFRLIIAMEIWLRANTELPVFYRLFALTSGP